MSTDSIDPTRTPGIAGDADTGAPHPQAPGGPDTSGTRNAPKVPPSSPHEEDGFDLHRHLVAVHNEVGKAVVGQEAAVTGLVAALLTGGYILLKGVPGAVKTLLVRPLATAPDLETRRIQSTPGLMPGDVTGSLAYDSRSAQFSLRVDPAFTNLLLTDEISHIPSKTQSAPLEAIEECQVSIDGEPRALSDPFTAIATQNPVEYEGAYPLPKAQLDHFLLKLVPPLPEQAQEIEMLSRHTSGFDPRDPLSAGLRAVAGVQELTQAQAQMSTVGVTPEVLVHTVDLMYATRSTPLVVLGVLPRGATALLAVSRAWTWLASRSFVTPGGVRVLALPALRYRIKLHAKAEMEGITSQSVIEAMLRTVLVSR